MVRHSRLFDEALERFQEEAKVEYRDSKDQLILKAFLGEKTSPQDAMKAAEDVRTIANKKFSGNKVIPEKWITTIMDNISIFIQAGDYATTSAPESVGLAWYAVRLTLQAVQGSYELYNLFGTGLSSISEIMIIIQHYDELYDRSDKTERCARDVLKHLFDTIIETYSAVLKFSFATKMHLSAGFLDKVGHGLGSFLGTTKAKFQGKLDTISELKEKILEDSQAVFQEQALNALGVTEKTVQDVKSTVDRIRDFQPQLKFWHDEQMDELKRLREGVRDDIKDAIARAKMKTPWEISVDESEKLQAILRDLAQDTRKGFLDLAASRYPGTCEWVFKQAAYRTWAKGNGTFLCISGYAGAGKSTLLSVIAKRVMGAREDDKSIILLYSSCGPSQEASRRITNVYYSLISQLYMLARNMSEDTENAGLLRDCNHGLHDFLATQGVLNEAFVKTKEGGPNADGALPQNAGDPSGFISAFTTLVRTLGVNALIAIDEVDSLAQKEWRNLSSDLSHLLRRFRHSSAVSRDKKLTVQVLVGSATPFQVDVSGVPRSADDSPIVTLTHDLESDHGSDLKRKIYGSLSTVPGLSGDDVSQASVHILSRVEHDDYRFDYFEKAMEVMRQPLLRPLEKHLERLPDAGDRSRYDAELLRIGPDYARLLQTVLTWSLLGKVWPRAEVVMEDFNRVYRKPMDANMTRWEFEKTTKWEFVPLSSVEMDQLMVIAGLFLRLHYGDNDSCRIVVPNTKRVTEYCFASSSTTTAEQSHQAGILCARCQSGITPSISLHISEKEGHLDLALTCLTHLNNEVFQFRSKIARDPLEDFLLLERMEQLGLKTGEEMVKLAKSMVKNTTPAMDDGRLWSLERWDDSDDSMDDEDKEMVRLGRFPEVAHRQTREYWEESRRTATLDDVIEDISVHDGDEEEHDKNDVPDDTNDPSLRYEVQYWPYHLRQAEDRWTPEDRSGGLSAKWATLFAELDKLVAAQNEDIFQGWQRRYRTRSTGPFTLTNNHAERPRNPLHVACYLGLTTWIDHLLKKSAKVNELSGECNAIQSAASSRAGRRPEILALLLKAGADVNFETEAAPSGFHLWLSGDCTLETVDQMMRHGANPGMVSKATGETALHHFAKRGTDVTAFDMLMAQGGELNAPTRDGYQPLHILLSRPSVPHNLLEAFVTKYKADVNAELPNSSMRPLHLAARRGDVESLKILVKSEILEIDDEDEQGNTALQIAAMNAHEVCVRVLKNKGADLEHHNKQGMTALHQAAWFGSPYCVESLLLLGDDGGADPLKTDLRNATPLFYACMSGRENAAEKLVDHFRYTSRLGDTPISEINKPNKDNKTPLRQAALKGFDGVVFDLIAAAESRDDMPGLDIDKQDTKKGMSALHCASRYGHLEVVKDLLKGGADIKLKDAKGRTALTHALETWALCHVQGMEERVSALIDADPKAASADPEVAAICAIHGSTNLLKKLRGHGADLTLRDRSGWTPLDLARKFEKKDAEAYLKKAAWSGALPSRWVNNSSRVTLSEDGLSVAYSSPQRLCISTDNPLPAGLDRYYFEVTLKKTSSSSSNSEDPATPPAPRSTIAIGFGTFGGPALTFPGCEHKRWAKYAVSCGYLSSGSMCKSPSYRSEPSPDQSYGPGDTVGCGVDLEGNTSWFALNGKKLVLEFNGIQGRLYPLLGLHGSVEVETNFQGPFKWEEGNEMEWRVGL
ncbi:ankyrin repeat-containing domain protein [Lasiosphaeris hirsuta]|uniref:Ankyrin repeat-containing domain protein n=1 Tax=Lasiosphaeris hirsuta TaxID=260670 RepID=A0AA40DWW7_9PEZI|nr:ankyrin repeat-containing domain protein [Lasiosphaeris hirsuta]